MVAAVKIDEQEWHKLFQLLTGEKIVVPTGQEQEYAQHVAIAQLYMRPLYSPTIFYYGTHES